MPRPGRRHFTLQSENRAQCASCDAYWSVALNRPPPPLSSDIYTALCPWEPPGETTES